MIAGYLNINSQETDTNSTQRFSEDLKKLVALNSSLPNVVDLRHKEAVNIMTNATARQIVKITAPYINSTILNAKNLCLSLLNDALFKKAKIQLQKQEIVEMLCKNYLSNDHDIQVVSGSLFRLTEKDFNPAAKKYIAELLDPEPRSFHSIVGKLLAVAQVRESIPWLWKVVNKDIKMMTHHDVDILASLARMNEKQAARLLCGYYNNTKNRTDYRYIFISGNLAFSLDSTVLNCMVNDFKTLDLEKVFRDGDTGFYPAGHLGTGIAMMLKNYPYQRDFYVDTKLLLNWLNQQKQVDLVEK